jgi:anti-sigma regulatory factor (Ser/Thr protein kinase)
MTIPLSTNPGEQRIFPARLAALDDAAAFAHAFCERHAVDPRATMRLVLIIEELFTNTVHHGYGGDTDQPIRVAVSIGQGTVALLYEDAAPRYDPLARLEQAPDVLAAPVEARPVGGLGVLLVGELAESARYAYEDAHNRLWLELRA